MDAATRLEKVREDKKPTRLGIQACGAVMAEMLRIGWRKEDLDELEILFWRCRDSNGNVLK